ncbi:hypothetical protein B9Z65_7646 [Elsinoe australis]|uniref:Protein bem46 n=1 Tax=Elsinoe australis TaxID=40998 RepID=A0A2P8A052_9PEZI|nr:hypothetical protein B9Z65_7646 [Elsinoe australis]
MPSLPPYSRSEKLEDYQSDCGQVVWREKSTFSTDGKKLALATGDIDYEKLKQGSSTESGRRLVVLYFQGNGSSTPPRLPLLSRVVTAISQKNHRSVTLAALSYRGYWNSTGQPSQAGIEDDAQSFFSWASRTYPGADIVIWGQSIGSGIATTALATLYETSSASKINVARVILETPFVNMRRMLADLYPQKWLPYRHLWPFLRCAWDSEKALRRLEASGKRVPPILLLPATDDEVVPSAEADWLEDLCKVLRLHYRRVDVDGALHNEASTKLRGRQAIANFVHDPMSK